MRSEATSAAPVSRRATFCAARVPAARVGPGHPGLRRYRQGEQEAGRDGEPGVLASGLGVFPWRGIGEAMPFGSPLLLTDNYNHTTNDPTTEAQSAQRTHRDFFGREILCSPPAWRSLRLPAAAPGSRRAMVAAGARVPAAARGRPCGPGRPRLRRCRQGGLACLTSARARGQEARLDLRAKKIRAVKAEFNGQAVPGLAIV